jgi:nucleotide-binding universal stress UspA family protein
VQLLKEAINSAQEEGAQYIEKILTNGDPVRVILDTANARDIGTIVMGSRGLSDFAGVVMGSVSHKVSHSSKCRVITVS